MMENEELMMLNRIKLMILIIYKSSIKNKSKNIISKRESDELLITKNEQDVNKHKKNNYQKKNKTNLIKFSENGESSK